MAVMLEQAVLDRKEENIKMHSDIHGLHESTQDLQRMDSELDAHEREFLLGYYISCIKLYGAKKKLFKMKATLLYFLKSHMKITLLEFCKSQMQATMLEFHKFQMKATTLEFYKSQMKATMLDLCKSQMKPTMLDYLQSLVDLNLPEECKSWLVETDGITDAYDDAKKSFKKNKKKKKKVKKNYMKLQEEVVGVLTDDDESKDEEFQSEESEDEELQSEDEEFQSEGSEDEELQSEESEDEEFQSDESEDEESTDDDEYPYTDMDSFSSMIKRLEVMEDEIEKKLDNLRKANASQNLAWTRYGCKVLFKMKATVLEFSKSQMKPAKVLDFLTSAGALDLPEVCKSWLLQKAAERDMVRAYHDAKKSLKKNEECEKFHIMRLQELLGVEYQEDGKYAYMTDMNSFTSIMKHLEVMEDEIEKMLEKRKRKPKPCS
ncbi:stress response protein NST1-like [Papaver somniferum]|uniref:stress response protein NST1-like n=1 Tax=Papaver somniferum TaxID=3469 RepID=UPI000E6F5248|nr:stress response protein NST1-like [Papaver somniferum]